MIAFLRLFPSYRAMEARSKECEQAQWVLQGRTAELMRQNELLIRQADEARKGELYAIKTMANYSAQQLHRVAPFEEAARLPDEELQRVEHVPPAAEAVTQAVLKRQSHDAVERFKSRLRKNYETAGYVVPEQ